MFYFLESRKLLTNGGYTFTNFNVPNTFNFANMQNDSFKP